VKARIEILTRALKSVDRTCCNRVTFVRKCHSQATFFYGKTIGKCLLFKVLWPNFVQKQMRN